MRVLRVAASQGHAVPSTAGYPVGPFNPEVLANPEIVVDEGEPPMPYGATAQNNFQGVKLYRCTYCSEVVTSEEIDIHTCGGE